jgi:O-antigen ligase
VSVERSTALVSARSREGRSLVPALRRWRPDAVTFLTLFLALLFLIPARRVVPGIGGVGRPAVFVGLACLTWWGVAKVVPRMTCRVRQPVRVSVYAFAGVTLVAYALAHGRGLVGLESRAADRWLVLTAAMVGVALLAVDGIPSRNRLDALLLRLVFLASCMAVVGWLQYLGVFDLAQVMTLPGLELNSDLASIGTRRGSDVSRVLGTATHPLEFGVIMAISLPLALHYALHAATPRQHFHRWAAVVLIGAGAAFSVSRAAVLGLIVVAIVIIPAWSSRLRLGALIVVLFGVPLTRTAFPGLIGTFRALFRDPNTDPSIQGRTGDYGQVFDYIADRPWFGRGPGTFMPERYFFLDNEVLMTLVTRGFVGLAAFVGLFLTPMVLARRVARRGPDDASRHLGQALLASITAAFVTSVTFDALSFATYSGTVFVLMGAAGALWRFSEVGEHPEVPEPRAPVLAPARRIAADSRRSSGER